MIEIQEVELQSVAQAIIDIVVQNRVCAWLSPLFGPEVTQISFWTEYISNDTWEVAGYSLTGTPQYNLFALRDMEIDWEGTWREQLLKGNRMKEAGIGSVELIIYAAVTEFLSNRIPTYPDQSYLFELQPVPLKYHIFKEE